jgi:hypothetical protein
VTQGKHRSCALLWKRFQAYTICEKEAAFHSRTVPQDQTKKSLLKQKQPRRPLRSSSSGRGQVIFAPSFARTRSYIHRHMPALRECIRMETWVGGGITCEAVSRASNESYMPASSALQQLRQQCQEPFSQAPYHPLQHRPGHLWVNLTSQAHVLVQGKRRPLVALLHR